MNETSTRGSGWKWDCEHFAKQKETFKIQHISTAAHEEFCTDLSATHKLEIVRQGTTVTFIPSV